MSSIFAPKPTAQPEQSQQPGPAMSTGAQPVYFNSLLEKGKKRTRDADGGPGFQELPSLQLGLGDIAKRVRELGGAGTPSKSGRGGDSRA